MNGLNDLAAEAARVDAEAAGTDQPGPGQPGTQAQPEKVPTEAVLEKLLTHALDQTADRFPSLRAIWTPEKIAMFSMALAPVLDKYELDAFGWFDQYKVEIVAAWICVPLLWSSFNAVRRDLEPVEKDITPRSPAPAAAAAPPGPAPVNEEGIPTR